MMTTYYVENYYEYIELLPKLKRGDTVVCDAYEKEWQRKYGRSTRQ